MKSRLLVASLAVAFLAAGCGKKDTQTSTSSSAAAPAAAEVQPAPTSAVEVTAGDNMKFSVSTIQGKAGQELKITLVNIGSQPKEVMGHNLVILKPGTDVAAFAAAAMAAKATDYIPENMKDQVVAHTPMLGPRKSADITVTLPAGDYTFICSFPAHYQVGMKGVLSIK